MYLLSSIPHTVTLIAPPFANVFMRISIWLSYQVACGLLLISYPIIWVMPESLKHNAPGKVFVASADESLLPAVDREPVHSEETEPLLQPHSQTENSSRSAPNSWRQILGEIIALFQVPTLPFVFLLFLVKPIALMSKAFTYQFASESFRWEMSQTTWLRVSEAAGSALVTLIFLPLSCAILIRRGFRSQKLDLGTIRGSLCVAVVGFGMLWQARASWMLAVGKMDLGVIAENQILMTVLGLFICGLSEGLEPGLQGLATSLIDSTYNARMFTTIAVIETVARLIGGPLMARLFSIGRSEGHGSKAINFLTSSIVFLVLEVVSWTAKVK